MDNSDNIQGIFDRIPLCTETVGSVTELMPAADASSGSRVQMQGAHYLQAPWVVGNEPRNIFTGSEFEYGKTTFNVIAESDCRVMKVISRYATGEYGIGKPLETYVFVQMLDDQNEVGVIHIPKYLCNHQYFGFDYVITPLGRKLKQHDILARGDVLADSPGNINGEYALGINANAILVSHPQVIEDAVLVRRKFADKMLSYGYFTGVMNVGPNEFLLYPHVDESGNRRMIPRIGDKVGMSGILLAKRSYNPLLAGIEMTEAEMSEICGHFDDPIYTDPGAEVIDIKIWQGDIQVSKYRDISQLQALPEEDVSASSQFMEEIREFYSSIKSRFGKRLRLTPEMHALAVMAIADAPDGFITPKDLIIRKKQFGYENLEDYRIEVTVRYEIPLDVSGKITDTFGGKGIVGAVEEDKDMMIGEDGTEIDIAMAENATLRRTNYNRMFEHTLSSSAGVVRENAIKMMDEGRPEDEIIDYVFGFIHGTASMWEKAILKAHPTKELQMEFINDLRNVPLRMNIRHERPEQVDEIMKFLDDHYPPRRTRLWVTNPLTGERELTDEEFTIGQLYMIRLDKTGRDFSAISACRFQQFGTIAKLHSRDKHRRPIREHSIKFHGEAEERHQLAYSGGAIGAEAMDRSNNPIVQDEMTEAVLLAERPMCIEEAVDRKRFPLGRHNGLAICHHVLATGGTAFTTQEH